MLIKAAATRVLLAAASARRPACTATRRVIMSAASSVQTDIADWPDRMDNSLLRELRPEDAGRDPHSSREVNGAHFTRVRPTVSAPSPTLVALAPDVATMLGLDPTACASSDDFLQIFAGQVPERVETWATCYGASFAGRYGGQRGDGRAIAIGIVDGKLEVQLKGAGVTPYSRRFDGRAVLRSCVREFLASEHMHALGVPTTRALCIVTTGEDVMRAWYASDSNNERMVRERGAVGTRVSSSFLRFGQVHASKQARARREHSALTHSLAHAHFLIPYADGDLSPERRGGAA